MHLTLAGSRLGEGGNAKIIDVSEFQLQHLQCRWLVFTYRDCSPPHTRLPRAQRVLVFVRFLLLSIDDVTTAECDDKASNITEEDNAAPYDAASSIVLKQEDSSTKNFDAPQAEFWLVLHLRKSQMPHTVL